MTWLASIVIAALTAVAGLAVAGLVAGAVVTWYRISSFEAGSGYFIVANALLGSIAGAVVGLVTSRLVARRARKGFLKALAASLGVVVAIGGAVAGTARLLADVAPELDGQRLLLAIELRWPPGAEPPSARDGVGVVTLGSATASGRVRVSRDGPLWLERATAPGGRWVAEGAVELFTSRGTHVLEARAGQRYLAGFVVPIGGRPDRRHLQWSEWLPERQPGAAAGHAELSGRFRVVRVGDPLRTERVGPFEVGTAPSSFFRIHPLEPFSAVSWFRILHSGRPVRGLGDVRAAAVVEGATAALLVESVDERGEASCRLVVDAGADARVDPVTSAPGAIRDAPPLTSDTEVFRLARSRSRPSGWLDRDTFRTPGLFLLHDAALDTRTLTVRSVTSDPAFSAHTGVPPLGLSPDGLGFLRFGFTERSTDRPALLVARLDGQPARTVAIDRARMRYGKEDEIDPGWVLHHFEWTQGRDATYSLVERQGFAPLSHQGHLVADGGSRRAYRLAPAGADLREALVAFLVADLRAERIDAADPAAYTQQVRVDGQTVLVSASADAHDVVVSVDPDAADDAVVERIAKRFNAVLRTGKYDALFGK